MADAAPSEQPPKGKVAIVDTTGAVSYVAAKDAARIAEEEGAELASSEQIRQHELQKEFGGIGGAAAAAGLGAARGLTFGGSDYAITALGGEGARRSVQGYQEANPLASLGGEVAGAIAPALIPGGQGAAARILTAPSRGLGMLARGAEGAAARIVGREAESVLGRVAQRAIRSGAGAAAEGAVYGVGHEISDAAIQNHELTAGKVWAGAGKGALLGFGLGAAAGTMGQLAREGVGAIARRLPEGKLGAKLQELSSSHAVYATRAGKDAISRAERYGGEGAMREHARFWQEEGPGLIGKKRFGYLKHEELGAVATAGLEKHVGEIGRVIDHTDQVLAGKGRLPKMVDVIDDLERVADKLDTAQLGSRPAVNRLRDIAAQARMQAGIVDATGSKVAGADERLMSIREVHEFRKSIDLAMAPEGGIVEPHIVELRKGLESRIQKAVEEAGGKKLGEKYTHAKKGYEAYATLQNAAANATGGPSRAVDMLADRVGSTASQQVGTAVGMALGGPVKAVLGSVLGGAVGGVAENFVRSRGDFIAADLLSHVSRLGSLERASAMVDARIGDGVRAFLTRGSSLATRGYGGGRVAKRERGDSDDDNIRVAQYVTHLNSNPEAMNAHLERTMGDLGKYAPSVSVHAAIKAQTMIANLAAQAPRPYVNSTLTAHDEKLRYAPADVAKFRQYRHGTEDPLSILPDMKAGYISPFKLQGVRDNHPEVYLQMQTALVEQILADRMGNPGRRGKKPLTWEQKKVASFAFNLPSDDTLENGFIQRQQQAAAAELPEEEQGDSSQQQMGGRRPIESNAEGMQTATEQLSGPIY